MRIGLSKVIVVYRSDIDTLEQYRTSICAQLALRMSLRSPHLGRTSPRLVKTRESTALLDLCHNLLSSCSSHYS